MLGYRILLALALSFFLCSRLDSQDISIPIEPLRVGYWSTKDIRCGIAIYTQHIVKALKNGGHKAFIYAHNLSAQELIKQAKKDALNIINIQYEPGIMPPKEILAQIIAQLKKENICVFMTIHRECEDLVTLATLADHLIFHKTSSYFKFDDKVHFLEMGAPVYAVKHLNKKQVRKRYGFSEHDIILSTFGFLAAWKEYSIILELLVPWLKTNPNHRVQLLTSFNDMDLKGCEIENKKIKDVIQKYKLGKQVAHVTEFLTEHILLERLWLSDLGYLWAPIETQSSSAASKQFIAARLPLVTTDSSHYHDINLGIVKTPKDRTLFIKTLCSLIAKPHALAKLYKDIVKKYFYINYNTLINKHVELFRMALALSHRD